MEEIDYAEYSRLMRKALASNEQIHSNGDINHEYFLHKKGGYFGKSQEAALLRVLDNQTSPLSNVADIKAKAKLLQFVEFICNQNSVTKKSSLGSNII